MAQIPNKTVRQERTPTSGIVLMMWPEDRVEWVRLMEEEGMDTDTAAQVVIKSMKKRIDKRMGME